MMDFSEKFGIYQDKRLLTMRIEHIALQVNDPDAVAEWYVRHLGMKVARHVGGPSRTYFLGDDGNQTLIEIYHNTAAPLPDYAAMDPLLLHIAFSTEDMEGTRAKLIEAGCAPVGEIATTPAGDQLCMLRDPWGLAIQLALRATPLVEQSRLPLRDRGVAQA